MCFYCFRLLFSVVVFLERGRAWVGLMSQMSQMSLIGLMPDEPNRPDRPNEADGPNRAGLPLDSKTPYS